MEDIALNNRLLLAAKMVEGDVVADIGTDHGKLPVYLVLSGKVKKGYACDIKSGPLSFAESLVKDKGLEDKIELILCDGLKNVPIDKLSDIVIAGMGGETIFEILNSALISGVQFRNINLVLNPMTKAERLRESLYKSGFFIKEEKAVLDSGRVYSVMKCGFSGEKKEICGLFKYLGKIDLSENEGRAYLEAVKLRLKKSLMNPETKNEALAVLEEIEGGKDNG